MIDPKEIPETIRSVSNYFVDIFSGYLIIVSVYYAFVGSKCYSFGEQILNVIDFISKDIYKFIFFIITSWIIGFISSELVSLIPISREKKGKEKKNKRGQKKSKERRKKHRRWKRLFDSTSSMAWPDMNLVHDFISDEKLKHRARSYSSQLRTKHLYKTLGSALLISSLVLSIAFIMNSKIVDLILSLLFIFFTILCEIQHRRQVVYLDLMIGWYFEQMKEEELKNLEKEASSRSL